MTSAKRYQRGFSLVELLVTMTIGSILLFVAAAMLSRAGDSYDRGSGSVSAEREARAVLTQMAGDLSKGEWHKDTRIESSGDGWKQAKLGFFSLQPDDAQSEDGRNGDLCAVNYYLKEIKVGNATVRCLMRGFRESGEVFPSLGDGGDVGSLFEGEDADEPVAFGVLSFEAEPLSRGPSGKWEKWTENPDTAPEAIRVRLVVARRELLGKLTTDSDWASSPRLGKPAEAANNPDLEVYEAIQRFGNDA
jgi:prepilin-type N-terminal cleavage/methylation domain-containing protein